MAPKANVVAAIPDGYRIYIYIFFVLIFVQEQTGIIPFCFMALRPLNADTLPNRIDLEAFEDYDRLLTVNYWAMHGPLAAVPLAVPVFDPLAAVPLAVPVFEVGLFMVVHAHGLLMTSDWIRYEGSPRGYLQFGERFAVLELSMHFGYVRARVERWDGVLGYISVYNTQAMQHFVVSMEGQPASYLPRDLLRGLSRDLLRGLADVLYQSRPLLFSL
jgi:hypothetical protein